jgi:GTP-binding protein YchF
MKIGIVGLSGSGKTLLFNAFIGEEESRQTSGIVQVPDERLYNLSALFNPKSIVPATVVFEDCLPVDTKVKQDRIKLFDSMKTMDAFVMSIGAYRCFDSGSVKAEVDKLRFEILMNDLDFVTKRVERIDRELRALGKNAAEKEKESHLLKKIQPVLEEEKFLNTVEFEEQELKIMANYNLLTVKPMLYVLNIAENTDESKQKEYMSVVREILDKNKDSSPILLINAKLEWEVSILDDEEIGGFMEEYGITELAKNRIINEAFSLLNLLTFFTVGEDECRAWNIHHGDTSVDAAGAIHSDLARGFIRAEVVECTALLELKGLNEAKKAGKLRLEGKTYKVKDGDIVHIMYNI